MPIAGYVHPSPRGLGRDAVAIGHRFRGRLPGLNGGAVDLCDGLIVALRMQRRAAGAGQFQWAVLRRWGAGLRPVQGRQAAHGDLAQ